MNKGYVGELRHDPVDLNQDIIVFWRNKRDKKREFIFANRVRAVEYFNTIEHLADDDITRMFWFDEGEDLPRNLLNGQLIKRKPEYSSKGYVARHKEGITLNTELEFIMDARDKKEQKLFDSREEAIEFLRDEFRIIDIEFMYWFTELEDQKQWLESGIPFES
jgi:hypothetical protein